MDYGYRIVKPESIVKFDRPGMHTVTLEAEIIPLRALKGLIWGFYSPTPWTLWLRVAVLPYGVEVTRFGHLVWWKRYCVRILRVKG